MSTIAFSVGSVHPAAAPYYRLFPSEPIPGSSAYLTISRVFELADNRVETLLQAIAQHAKAKGTIVVVSHGNESGISFTVGAGRGVRLDVSVIQALRANLAGRIDDRETAQRLKFGTFNATANPTGVAQVVALKAAMAPVRALELARVDLRACNTGRQPETLRQLQFFFNADLCCAPDSWDTFGPVPVSDLTSNPTTWKEFRQKHRDAIIVGAPGRRFALSYKVLGDEHKVMLAAIADSQAAVDVWVANHLPPNNQYTGGPLYYHGLTRDQSTILFAGEAAYRERLVAVTNGRDTTVRVDPNAPLQRP